MLLDIHPKWLLTDTMLKKYGVPLLIVIQVMYYLGIFLQNFVSHAYQGHLLLLHNRIFYPQCLQVLRCEAALIFICLPSFLGKLYNELSRFIFWKNHKTFNAPWIGTNVYLNVQLIFKNSKSMKLSMFDLNTICQHNVFLSSLGENRAAELTFTASVVLFSFPSSRK